MSVLITPTISPASLISVAVVPRGSATGASFGLGRNAAWPFEMPMICARALIPKARLKVPPSVASACGSVSRFPQNAARVSLDVTPAGDTCRDPTICPGRVDVERAAPRRATEIDDDIAAPLRERVSRRKDGRQRDNDDARRHIIDSLPRVKEPRYIPKPRPFKPFAALAGQT